MCAVDNTKPRLISTVSWVLYDLANTAYSMNVVSLYFGTWLLIHLGQPDLMLSLANSISMGLVAITLPVLGELSDCKGKKLVSLLIFTILCIGGTALLGGWDLVLTKWVALSAHPIRSAAIMGWLIVMTYIAANYAYQGGLVFYNALLPSVSTPRTMGRVSGYGVAVGYFGSAIGLLVARVFVDGTFLGRKIASLEGGGPAASFLPTALLFFVFAVPIFIFVSEPPLPAAGKRSWNLRKSYRRVWTSLRDTQKYPGLLRFLVAKFFYEDSIETVIIFMGVFTQKVMGFTLSQTNTFFFLVIPAAVIGSALCGVLTDHYGPKKTLVSVIALWICALGVVIANSSAIVYWMMGGVIGALMGATWTSARPLLVTLVPGEMLGEFFGLYALTGKAAAIIGPLIWGGVTIALNSFSVAVQYKSALAVLAGLMSVGLLLLCRVPDLHRQQQAASDAQVF